MIRVTPADRVNGFWIDLLVLKAIDEGSELAGSLWKAWFIIKKNLKPASNHKDMLGIHSRDSIWWPILDIHPVEANDLVEALKLHKMNINL